MSMSGGGGGGAGRAAADSAKLKLLFHEGPVTLPWTRARSMRQARWTAPTPSKASRNASVGACVPGGWERTIGRVTARTGFGCGGRAMMIFAE